MRLGIDIGGTNTKWGIFTSDFHLIESGSFPTPADEGPEAVVAALVSTVTLVRERHQIASLGVGFPSVVLPGGHVANPPNLRGWTRYPLRDRLIDELRMPVEIDNDANVAALAEAQLGAGAGTSHLLYVTLGTGVGGGIIIGGKIYRGEQGGAGEIGHTIVYPFREALEGQPAWRTGVLEEYTGRVGILRLAQEKARGTDLESRYHQPGFDVHDLGELFVRGDHVAVECLTEIATLLSAAFVTALNLLDIRTMVVGGGISNLPDAFFELLTAKMRVWLLPSIAPDFSLRKAHFRDQAGIVGAALLGATAANE